MFNWKPKATNAIYLKEDNGGKGRPFESRFLEAGLVKYSFGVCLLTKETIDKFINSFVGCPVIIDHQDITDENAKDERVGVISEVWYNEKDGWFWCKGIIFDDEAIDLIKKGYSVSCQYGITEYQDNTENKLHNGNEFDKYILNGKPEHLAIVKNPRYESAYIAVNAIEVKAENEDKWITIKKGDEAIHSPLDKNNKIDNKKIESWEKIERELKESFKDKATLIKTEEPKEINKQENDYTIKKETQKAFLLQKDGINFWILKGYFKNGELTNKGKEIFEREKRNKEQEEELEREGVKFEPSWESEKAYGVDTYFEDYDGRLKPVRVFIPKSQIMENGNIPLWLFKKKIEELNEKVGYAYTKGDYGSGFKVDFFMGKIAINSTEKILTILDNKLIEIEVEDFMKINKAQNEIQESDEMFNFKKENNMDEIKEMLNSLLVAYKAKNEADKEDDKKEDDKKAMNENVDKRKLIDEIGGILKGKVDDELWRTIIGKAEKIAYEKSEAGTADNKCKNKCKNEDDEAEYEDLKEDTKESAENKKAKNSIEEMFYNGDIKTESNYISQKKAIELGKELF